MSLTESRPAALVAGLLALAWSLPAAADGPRQAVPLIPAYKQECGSCHTPYPPSMLPPVSWQRLMLNLPQHFGTDASLDAQTVQVLSVWLTGTSSRTTNATASPEEDRITRTPWFVREHRKVSAATWKLPAVRSAANCAACHPGAEQGDFDEHALRIPR